MADDVTLRWGSTGFEKISQEFDKLQATSEKIRTWAESISGAMTKTRSHIESHSEDVKRAGERISSVAELISVKWQKTGKEIGDWLLPPKKAVKSFIDDFENLGGAVLKVGAIFTGFGAIVAGAAAAAIGGFGKAVLEVTEKNKGLEASLYGATKSWDSVTSAVKFADEYSRKYPATTEDILTGLRGLSEIPTLKPMIQKGDVDFMKGYMDTVMKLTSIRPEAGVRGAEQAITAAMMGRWAPLQRQYYMRPEAVAEELGVSKKGMEASPLLALRGIEQLTARNIGAEAMTQSMQQIKPQIIMIREEWGKWLEAIGKTGIYDKVVGYLNKLRESFAGFMHTDQMRKWTTEINSFMEGVADTIARVFTKGVNLKDISGFSDLFTAIKQVAKNASAEISSVWQQVKGPLSEGLIGAFSFAGTAVVQAVTKIFVPIGLEIAKATYAGLKTGMEEHPIATLLAGGLAGAKLGSTMGPWGALIGAGVGMEAVALPKQISAVKEWWGALGETMRSIGTKIEAISGIDIPKLHEVEARHVGFWEAYDHLMKRIGGKIEKAVGWPQIPEAVPLPEPIARPGAAEAKALLTGPKDWLQQIEADEREAFQKFSFGAVEALDQTFGKIELWAKMAGRIAKMPVGPEAEQKSAGYLFATGKIPFEKYQQMGRIEEFEKDYESRLLEIVKPTPLPIGLTEAEGIKFEAAEAPTRMKAYEQLFGISVGRGDIGKAQEYMNRSLDELVKITKAQQERAGQDSGNLDNISKNTNEMLVELRKKDDKSQPTVVVTNVPQTAEARPLKDELREAVTKPEEDRGC